MKGQDRGDLSTVTVESALAAEEDVVVGASKREQSLGSVASAVTVISGDQIRRFGFRTVAEALSTVAGVYIVDDRMIERVGFRGIQLLGDANTRILVLIDGSPLNEPWSQYVDTSYALPINLDDVARVEVIRGPVSSVYGTNAFLGIINIVTLGADKAPPVYGRIGGDSLGSVTGNAGFGVGSVNRQVRGNIAWVRRGADQLDYSTFPADPGQLWQTDADRLDALNGAVQVHFDRLFFQARGVTRTRQLPGAPYGSVVEEPGNQNTDSQIVTELGYNRDLGDAFSIAGRAYADAYRFRGLLEYGPDGTFESQGNSQWYGGELRGLLDLASLMPKDGKLDLTMGVAAEWSRTDSSSFIQGEMEPVDIRNSFNTQGVYSELDIQPVSWLAATAGVRYDRNSQFENNVSPRTALFLKRGDDAGIKFLFAEGFRNPSIFEAFFRDDRRYRPSCGDVVQCQMNGSSLSPENISSYEVVLWGRPLPGINLRLSGWRWELTNLIEKREATDPDNGELRLQFQNLASLVSQGIEFESSYRDTRGWFAFANVALAQVRRNEAETFNAPEITGKAGISTPLLAGLFHISSDATYLSERLTRAQPRINVEVPVAPAYIGWNAALYAPSIAGFDVTIGVRNILGTREMIPAQEDYDRESLDDETLELRADELLLVPGRGREIYGRVGYHF